MYDIISQIEQAAAGSVTDEIRLLKQRRQSLDHVIKFTLGINRLQHSLESVLLLKKPAKDIPRDLLKLFGSISDAISNLPSSELEKRLTRIEESIQHDINTIMGISNEPGVLDSRSSEQSTSDDIAEKLHTLVNDFRRRTNTAIVLKLHLRTRGMKVAETIIPITPEALVSQITKLVIEEKKCHERTKEGLTQLDNQVVEIIRNKDCPEQMRTHALIMRQQIYENIEHLNKGRDIETLPFVIEIIQINDIESEPFKPVENKKKKPHKTTNIVGEKKDDNNKIDKPRTGLLKRVIKWISSPWSVKWHDIE